MKKLLLILSTVLLTIGAFANKNPHFSTAGFYELGGTPRKVYSMNPSWLIHVGAVKGSPETMSYDDAAWEAVNLPSGMEIMPYEASGGKNYRGQVWYRKHFEVSEDICTKRTVLYFEAVMGKSKIWVNGTLAAEHFGGFTPIPIDVTNLLKTDGENVIAVWADNSDDPIYPPGKPQAVLDFCYFGGIYRDVWLYTTSKESYITDPNMMDKVAGGGFFASFHGVSDNQATVQLQLDVDGAKAKGKVSFELIAPDGTLAAKTSQNLIKGENKATLQLKNPNLWSPENPNLYTLNVRITNTKGEVVDGYSQRIGVRSFAFSYRQGFILNGKPYPRKLIGANRHQDFAVIGNALSNTLHYRDVLKLKNAGMEIIRNAHYPQDPAFMDACDQLGLFVIVNTPGWQFWNNEPIFEQRVYADIRTMARRDRNHPSVLMWEPILNETWYPEPFAKNVRDIVKSEIPFAGANFTASDMEARGSQYFDIIFTHPVTGNDTYGIEHKMDTSRVYFTREWGDNVDDWNSHNSTSRVARQWGEIPQLVQSKHYAAPHYQFTSYKTLQQTPAYHFGGTLWHSFDHQRGYHPDPFYGGVMDAFRRPKMSYYMFQGQAKHIEPMVYVAHEMTPFSPEDITVFSNCASVRLRTIVGDCDSVIVSTKKEGEYWFEFSKAWNFMKDKALSRGGKQRQAYILAEGLNEKGDVIASHRREMARRPTKLQLSVDTMNVGMTADGGDLVVVTAAVVDRWGNVKRLNNEFVKFAIQGQGRILASRGTFTNPAPIEWGEASVIVQSTDKPGTVKITASILIAGENSPLEGTIEFTTSPASQPLIYDKELQSKVVSSGLVVSNPLAVDLEEISRKLQQVEKQQSEFGEKR